LWLGAGVVIGFGCAMVAALYPGLLSIWTAHGIDAVPRIAHNRDAWQVANWMFAVGTPFALGGVAVLTPLLARVSAASALAMVALVLGTAGSTLFRVNLAYRLTVMLRTADPTNHSEPVPDWYADITAWADDGLLSAAGLLFGGGDFGMDGLTRFRARPGPARAHCHRRVRRLPARAPTCPTTSTRRATAPPESPTRARTRAAWTTTSTPRVAERHHR
jgi:hypothetical protein